MTEVTISEAIYFNFWQFLGSDPVSPGAEQFNYTDTTNGQPGVIEAGFISQEILKIQEASDVIFSMC